MEDKEGADRDCSSTDNTPPDKRASFKVITYMLETGIKLHLESVPIATACVIYHRFFRECKLEEYDPYMIAVSAIYLATKVCEQQVRLRDIINVCYRTLHKDRPPLEIDGTYWELRESITNCELLILRVLKFQIAFELPHKYLLHYMKSVQDWLDPDVWHQTPICSTAWAFLRDSYHSDVCLHMKPQQMAVSVLYFALQCYGVGIPQNKTAKKKWWQVFCEDMREEDIHSIIENLIDMYDSETKV